MNERILNIIRLCMEAEKKGHKIDIYYDSEITLFEVYIPSSPFNKDRLWLYVDRPKMSEYTYDEIEQAIKELIANASA